MKRFASLVLALIVVCSACRPNGGAQYQTVDASAQTPSLAPHDSFSHFAGQATFVFRPGGVAAGVVYTTWAALMAAVALSPGYKTVVIDDTLAAAHATAGTWSVDNVMFIGEKAVTALHIDDACFFTFQHLRISPQVPGFTFSYEGTTNCFSLASGIAVISGSGTLKSTTAHGFALVSGTGNLFVDGMAPGLVIGDGANRTFEITGAGATINFFMDGQSNLTAHAVNGPSGTVNNSQMPAAAFSAQADFAGTFATTFPGAASNIRYSPATPGNWNPAPTLVGPSLDQLAAPNTIGATDNTGTGTGTVTAGATGNFTKAKSGKVLVTCNLAGTTTAGTTVTVQLVRDAATSIGNPIVETTLSAGDGFHGSTTFVDTLPDTATHTYKCTGTAGSGNITAGGANSFQITAVELN